MDCSGKMNASREYVNGKKKEWAAVMGTRGRGVNEQHKVTSQAKNKIQFPKTWRARQIQAGGFCGGGDRRAGGAALVGCDGNVIVSGTK